MGLVNAVTEASKASPSYERAHQLETIGTQLLYDGVASVGTPVPPLHESGWAGISCSLLLMVVVVMNMLCGLARRNVDSGDDGQQEQRLTSVFGIGVSIFWLCIEVMGWLLKIQP